MEIIGYIASIFIGIALGLIGGGGSILTVPVLVYLFSIDVVSATAYSLFIVGITSAVGAVSYLKNGLVNVKTAIVFGVPSIITVYTTRAVILPAIPDQIGQIGNFMITKSMLIMVLFAILMIAASYSMIMRKAQKETVKPQKPEFNYGFILAEGLFVGLLTGLVGAGGGFLIIPALVMISKLPMKEAVATSLVIIAAKSLIGFFGESSETSIDWTLLGIVSTFAVAGIVIGIFLSKKINGEQLKPAFGWFVMVMGVYILVKEIFFI
jgi:uncharacterized membrane protein YfcA